MVATIRAGRRFLRCVFPLFYFALILLGKGPGATPALSEISQNPPHIAPDLQARRVSHEKRSSAAGSAQGAGGKIAVRENGRRIKGL
jgi:hypothetical protein